MKLEGVIISCQYSDFLSWTLPLNKSIFDKLVVVTCKEDKKSKWLCEYYHVECVQTDRFYENGDKFNKAKGINEGLKRLSKDGWVLHLYSDIVLPPLTKHILNNIPLDKETIYGFDRLMCPNYEEWLKFYENPKKIQEAWVYIHTDAFPMGVRIAEYNNKNQGYTPIGYAQLWNPVGSNIFKYPEEHGKADRTDVLFAKHWKREKRQLLPELLCIHLDSEGLTIKEQGKNWSGRKTKEFTFNTLMQSRGYKPSCYDIIKNYMKRIKVKIGKFISWILKHLDGIGRAWFSSKTF